MTHLLIGILIGFGVDLIQFLRGLLIPRNGDDFGYALLVPSVASVVSLVYLRGEASNWRRSSRCSYDNDVVKEWTAYFFLPKAEEKALRVLDEVEAKHGLLAANARYIARLW